MLADAAAAETTTTAAPEAALPEDMDMEGMDEDLRAALQMSMQVGLSQHVISHCIMSHR